MEQTGSKRQRLFSFQDAVLAALRPLQTGFYLGGHTAASRGYLNHRLTYEMVFACNDEADFGLWAERVIDSLLRQESWHAELVLKESRRVVLALQQEGVPLSVVLLNDGPQHLGKIRDHAQLGRLDSPENIAAQAVVSLVTNPEPGDMADLLGLCMRFKLALPSLLTQPESKAAGVFAPDLARVLHMATRSDWELVRWIQPPPEAVYLEQLRRLAERLLGLEPLPKVAPAPVDLPVPPSAELIMPMPAPPPPAKIPQQIVTAPIDVIPEEDDQYPASDAIPPADQPESNAPAPVEDDYRTEIFQREPPAEPAPEVSAPPVEGEPASQQTGVRRGTGILNFYRAMKAAGIDGFVDAQIPEDDSAAESPSISDTSPNKPKLPFLPPLPAVIPPSPKIESVPPPKAEPGAGKGWQPTTVTGDIPARPSVPQRPPLGQAPPSNASVPVTLKVSDMNKRSEPRRHVSYYIPVYDIGNGGLVGYLSDISKGGLCLDCHRVLVKGSKMNLRIDLTADLGPKSHLTFTGEVRWCHVDTSDANSYNAGIEITAITSDDARSFLQILEKYSTP